MCSGWGILYGDPIRNKTKNDKQLIQFCKENQLEVSNRLPIKPTFHHFNGTSKSRIDLIVQPINQQNMVKEIITDERNPTNSSCHDAVIIKLTVTLITRSSAENQQTTQ